MPRVKPQSPEKINNLDEATAALKEIAILQIKLDNIDNESSKKIAEIKEKAAKQGETARDRIKQLGSSLALYADYNKPDLFSEKKSIDLNWGIIGFRLSTKVSIKKTTLELLKKLFPGKGVKIEEKVSKDELSDWKDEDLSQVDAAKIQEDTFYYELNKEAVNKVLLK